MVQRSLFEDETRLPGEESVTWLGQNGFMRSGKIEKLLEEKIPTFRTEPFSIAGGTNRDLVVILREPDTPGEKPFPITTVSKQYHLVQHRDVLRSLKDALVDHQIEMDSLEGTLLLTARGERLHLSVTIPGYTFDPGDGHAIELKLHCMNSVDRSTALQIWLGWFRLICSNGLFIGRDLSQIRRWHLQSQKPLDIQGTISNQLELVSGDQRKHRDWYQRAVDQDSLRSWIDKNLAGSWGKFAAARAWHIIQTGYDGRVIRQPGKPPAHTYRVQNERKVPGISAPVLNAFHVGQVLSWIAGQQNTWESRLDRTAQIDELMTSLINS